MKSQLAGSFYKRHAITHERALTTCRHTVSGSLSLPFRGAFHLSLTVLVHYRSLGSISLGRWSSQIPTEFHVFRRTQDTFKRERSFDYGVITLCDGPFQVASSTSFLCNSV